MRLSKLQQFILKETRAVGGRVDRGIFLRYYKAVAQKPSQELQTKIISKSLLRLIDKGLLVGYGRRTPEKWFIESVALTAAGRKQAKLLLGQQQTLPLKKSRKKS